MRRRVLAITLALVAASGAARAAAYDDFANGIAAYERGDDAMAIPLLSAALAASDLVPNLKATAYLDRARAYLHTARCTQAIPDLEAARILNANSVDVILSMAVAQSCLGDFRSAERSYTAAIAINPTWQFFFGRGRARWALDDFAGAAADFAAVVSAAPKQPYPVLWLAIAQARLGRLDNTTIAQAEASLDLDDWPAPLVKFYLGRAGQPDIDAAVQAEAQNMAQRRCEADFYIGEWHLAHIDKDAAKTMLQAAADKCPPTFIEKYAAKVEVARLNSGGR